MSKRKTRKFKPFNLSEISTPGSKDNSNFNTTPIAKSTTDGGKSSRKGNGSQKKDVEKNTSRSQNLPNSKDHENSTETDYQVSGIVLDQSNSYVASKIQNLSVSSCNDISSEILDVKVESYVEVKASSDYCDGLEKKDNSKFDTEENTSTISAEKTLSKSRENLTTNDTQFTQHNQTSYRQKMNRDSKRFKEGQRGKNFHNETKPKCNDDKKPLRPWVNKSNDTQRGRNSPRENNNYNYSQGSKHFEEGQSNRYFHNKNKSRSNNTADLKQQQTVSNNFLGTKNFQESWDPLSENEKSNNKNTGTRDSVILCDESKWDDDTTDSKKQQNYPEENGDSPTENENLDKKNWNTGTKDSGILNANAQEYVPPFQVDSNEPGDINDKTDDDYFTNRYQPNLLKNKSFEMKNNYRENSDIRHSFPMAKGQQNFPKRYSDGSNKESRSNETSRDWRNKNSYDRRSESSDKEFKAFCDEERKKEEPNFIKVNEIQQDLFTMPTEYSLGHCVAEDMRMGSGIAVNFKREFKDLDVLLSQRQKQGGMAFLTDEKNDCTRYIYYLVTKRESTGKPTYEKFWSSVKKMRDHIREKDVRKLAIPRLGCGLDRLEWDRVKHMIEFLFRDVEVEITVCNFQQTEESPEKPLIYRPCKIVNELKSIADIDEETTIIYLSSEDGHVSSEMEQLSKKFSFLEEFKRTRRQLGYAVKYQVPKKYFLLYGCIVRKTNSDPFDFVAFNNCLKEINKNNRKDKYVYVGIQAIKDDKDDLLMKKILTLLMNNLSKVDIYVCWSGELAGQMPVSRFDE